MVCKILVSNDLARYTQGSLCYFSIKDFVRGGFMINNNKSQVERHYYGYLDDQFGDLRLPNSEGPHPVAIVIHGGYWKDEVKLDTIERFAESLTEHGIATWSIEHRRVGQEGGGWPGTFTDAALAVDYLPKLVEKANLDLTRVITIGHSSGGHMALWLAGRHRLPENSELKTQTTTYPLKGAISLAGVNDLAAMKEVLKITEKIYKKEFNPVRDLLGGAPDEVPHRYEQASPIQLLPFDVRQVLIHGALDIAIPIGISQEYKRVADRLGDNVKLVEIPSAEHFQLIHPKHEAWSIVLKETLALLSADE